MKPGVHLAKGRERALRWQHPWVYSGAITKWDDECKDGDLAPFFDAQGACLGWGIVNRRSKLAIRVIRWGEEEPASSVWRERLEAALRARRFLEGDEDTDAYRVVHSEADGLPGWIVDRYGDHLVVQLSSVGVERRREHLNECLVDRLAPTSIYHRGDADVRDREGLSLDDGLLWGEEPPESVEIRECGLRYEVDLRHGHKTGFYLDQRDNRQLLREIAGDQEVLNCFSYSGAFGVAAHAGGARRVVQVDSSESALVLARRNLDLNGMHAGDGDLLEANVFELLRQLRDQSQTYDVIVLDPPKFAFRRGQIESALRGYKDLNLLALKLLRPGGSLLTFSCSGAVSREHFRDMLAAAALDAGRAGQILRWLGPGADHPEALHFPESAYLKGCWVRVDSGASA